MGKRRFTEDNWQDDSWFKSLVRAFVACKTDSDTAEFLRDICTLSEMQAMAERLEVAKQLSNGLSYREVAKNTGASTTTVTRVAKFLEAGEGGYKKVLKAKRVGKKITVEKKNDEHSDTPGGIQSAAALRKYLNK